MKKNHPQKSDWAVKLLYAVNIVIILVFAAAIWLFHYRPHYIEAIVNLF